MKQRNIAISEEDIRRQVEKKFAERAGLIQHGISYAMTNIVLWAIWLFTSASFPWPLFVTLFWGIGMLSHYVDYTNKYGKGAQKREEEIEAEVMRKLQLARAQDALGRRSQDDDEPLEGADVYGLDNFKRRGLRLSDDGELLDLEPDDDEWLEEQGR